MRQKNRLYGCLQSAFLLLMVATMVSCESPLALPDVGPARIVLLGELVAGDSIYFRGGKSIPLKNGAKLEFELLHDLKVSVAGGQHPPVVMSGVEDDYTSWLYTLAYTDRAHISPGLSYQVTATRSGMDTASATVRVPQPFTAAILDTATVTFQGQPAVRFRERITDASGAHYYLIEAVQQQYIQQTYFFFNNEWLLLEDHSHTYDSLRQEGITPAERQQDWFRRSFSRTNFYTTDAYSEHLLSGNPGTQTPRLLLKDQAFNGGQHISEIYIPRGSIMPAYPGAGYQLLIQVKSIDADYFSYLQGYANYDPFFGSNVSAPARITGNIKGGVGILGGVFRHEFRYTFPE